jgi:pimeloyl-ACP methyl ester carboxylesterase
MARWIRHIQHAKVFAIADSGHCLPMEQPDLFNQAVLDFVRQH